MTICMVCGVEKTASHITGDPSPAAYVKFMEVYKERDQLQTDLKDAVTALQDFVGLVDDGISNAQAEDEYPDKALVDLAAAVVLVTRTYELLKRLDDEDGE